ncbi:hypothetical protein [Halovenus sp. HT40]|uniref:hypothetical protein n=1 Tax=Halovenus sp. HT40 TaxID=3126691 RepID=UPI00300F47B8
MTKNSLLADCTTSVGVLAVQYIAALFGFFGSVSRRCYPVSDAGRVQKDDRGGVGLYALIVVGLVVVGAAVFLVVGGGVLDDGTDDGEVNGTDPAPDQDPRPVDDGSDENGTEDSGSEDDSNGGAANDTKQPGPQYATISGSVNVSDLGPAEKGAVGLYNRSSGRFVELHDFENGSEFTFEELPPGHTYELSVESERAPPETLSVTPGPNETVQREIEVGHEFEGAYSYESNWTVAYEDGSVLEDGYQAIDSEGNAFSSWDDPAAQERYKNLYLARNNKSYTTFGQGEWVEYVGHFESNETTSTYVIRHGIGGVEKRIYLGEVTDPKDGDPLYEYQILAGAMPFDNRGPIRVYTEPETGYIRYVELELSKWEDSRITKDEAWVYNHESEEIVAIPEDFPLDDLPS